METLLHMNQKMIPIRLQKTRSRQKVCNKVKTIVTCKANFYQVLSLESQHVGFNEIKKAYRNMALQYHPDVCPPSAKEESTKRFVEVRKAYETLSDPISRKVYDYELGFGLGLGFDFQVRIDEERRKNFPREVWEEQLFGLKQRSHVRLRRKKTTNTC
ncbi:hypothetical protein JCGZ_24083 [Jatropha curcas]|uniref:J domain-containing protein n=1 Tax=Jatropha curcas TaxID=180498 RepID=A0A067LQL7_JATCU|nr:chaperone protein dnaJ 20, chloroplastic [Jatropha curcas]KDP46874.1 hypothetical protein JCGZ_24083 [Jatropha curcas]